MAVIKKGRSRDGCRAIRPGAAFASPWAPVVPEVPVHAPGAEECSDKRLTPFYGTHAHTHPRTHRHTHARMHALCKQSI